MHFSLTSSKNARVADLWQVGKGGAYWSLHFSLHFQGWEIKAVDQFLELIQAVCLHTLGRKFECRGRKIRGNSKSNISTTPYVLRIQNCFPAQEVWDISAPLRVCFFFFPGRLNRGRT